MSSTYSSDSGLFGYHWSCTGGKILGAEVERTPGVDIQFVGNPSTVAVVSSDANGVPDGGSVTRSPDGSFHVTMGGSNTGAGGPWQFQNNVPFVIVLL